MRKTVKTIAERAQKAGGRAYLVGGYVRDLLLNIPSNDLDVVVVGLSADTVEGLFPDAKLAGLSFPVYRWRGIEIALARKERSTGDGYNDFAVDVENVTLEEDLKRRDLTINAIATDILTGDIVDPFEGAKHIKDKVLVPTSDAFVEDPVRGLRAARFAARFGFAPSYFLQELCRSLRQPLASVPGERLLLELDKAFELPKPSRFFYRLRDFWLLDVTFPELNALIGRPQPRKYHPEGDAFVHTMYVLDRARELGADKDTLFAALVHDLGKAVTPDDDLPRHIDHERLGVPLVHTLCDRLHVNNARRKLAVVVTRQHLRCHRFLEIKKWHKRVDVITSLNGLEEQVTLACQADAQGRGDKGHHGQYPQRDAILNAAKIVRGVRGHQFAHLKNGQVIAQKMRDARANALKEAGRIPYTSEGARCDLDGGFY